MFKVVPDQLKVSDGWVRCGHCDGVFDASAHFQAIVESAQIDHPDAAVQQPHFSASENIAEETPAELLPPMAATTSRSVVAEVLLDVPNELSNDFALQIPQASSSTQPEVPFVPHSSIKSDIDDASVSAPLSSYLSAPDATEASDTTIHENHAPRQDPADRRALYGSTTSNKPVRTEDVRRAALPEVTFVQAAQRRDSAKKPIFRVLGVLLVMVLLGAVTVQVLVHERDAIASRYPALLPALEVLCEKMDCKINPPRVIEAITIDSSSFTQTGPDAYRLNFVLKNAQLASVAMPALEVTLTGSQNEVLIRKVLLPSEFGAIGNRLEQAAPFAGVFNLLVSLPSVPVAPLPAASSAEAATPDGQPVVDAPAVAAPVTGYRLFAFYP
jgi:hypothetical protein